MGVVYDSKEGQQLQGVLDVQARLQDDQGRGSGSEVQGEVPAGDSGCLV